MRRLDVDALDGLLDVEPTGAFPVTVPLPPVAEAAAVGWDDRLVRRMALAAAAGFVVAGALAGAGAGWSASRRGEVRAAAPTAERGEAVAAGVGAAGGGPGEVAAADPAGSLAAARGAPAEALAVAAEPAGSLAAAPVASTPAAVVAADVGGIAGAAPAAPAQPAPVGSPGGDRTGASPAPSTEARPKPADARADRWVVRFGFGAAGPEAGWEATVAEAARCAGRLEVVGYTCDAGDPAFNQDLSERRARAVASALAAAGVPEARLRARGGGPLDAADAPRRADRRRVELRCVPTT